MNPHLHAKYKDKAKIFKALAHPTRLFIVDELSRQKRCVCELTQMIEADCSTVSRHLAVLNNAGIIQDEKRGARVFYSLRAPCVLNFFSCLDSLLNSATGNSGNETNGKIST